MFLQAKRNRIPIYLIVCEHFIVSFGICGIFGRLGNNADRAFQIFLFCMCCNMCLLYTYLMIPVLVFPSELKLLRAEYFNRWYALKAYYLAMTLFSLPFPIVAGSLFSATVYYFTDQPREMDRFLGFCLINLMTSFISLSLGYVIGVVFNEKRGVVIASLILGLIIMLAIYGLGFNGSIDIVRGFAMKITFFRYAVEGICSALFYKRDPFNCEEDFCYYARPEVLMRDNSIVLTRYEYYISVLSIFLVVFKVGGYVLLKCRLNPKINQKLLVISQGK